MDEPHLHFPSGAAMICRMRTTKSATRHWHDVVREWQRSQPAPAGPVQAAPAFIEARIVQDPAPPARGGVIVLELRDGQRLRLEPGFDPALLRQVGDRSTNHTPSPHRGTLSLLAPHLPPVRQPAFQICLVRVRHVHQRLRQVFLRVHPVTLAGRREA